MLSRDELQKAIRGPIRLENVPEWGGDIGIRRITAADLLRLRDMVRTDDGHTPVDDLTATCELLSMALCDGDSKQIFSAAELHEWDGQQFDVLQRLVAVVQEHNGMGAKAAEDLEKNSESGLTSDST